MKDGCGDYWLEVFSRLAGWNTHLTAPEQLRLFRELCKNEIENLRKEYYEERDTNVGSGVQDDGRR